MAETTKPIDDGEKFVGPFNFHEVWREFNNPRGRVGVYGSTGQLCMHFENEDDAKLHCDRWNRIRENALAEPADTFAGFAAAVAKHVPGAVLEPGFEKACAEAFVMFYRGYQAALAARKAGQA